jgi:putative MATE family efflux protein|tara:strand:+ start:3380 stop:4732 length:1353 start_codon:yes stop_codon:yes gene_type:complete
MNNKTDQFLNDPIMPLLFKMSAPNTIAFFVQAIVVLTEIWFISKLGTISLAAVALAFPVLMLTQQMAFGAFGGAVTSSIARSMGSGDIERAEKLLWHALFIACAGALILLAAFLVGGEWLLKILGGEGLLLEQSLSYCMIFLSGAILIWLSGSLSAALRGLGNMRFPAILMVLASGIQVILSGGLILGWFGFPKMGISGAAVSALANGAFMTLIMFLKFSSSSSPIRLKLSRLSPEKELFKDILDVALPASLAPVFTVGTILVLTGLVGQFGTSALAGYGIGSRVEFLMIPLVFGIGTAMTAMVGTNIGAKNIARAEKIGFIGGISAGAFAGIIGVILALTPELWINYFATDEATYLVTKQYIQIVGVCYAFQGLGLSLYFASQGANAMKWPIIGTVTRFIIAALGGSIAVYWFESNLSGIFYSAAAAMLIFGLILLISLKMGAWRTNQS